MQASTRSTPTLATLPTDVLENLSFFLSVEEVKKLSICCKRLYGIFKNQSYWKARIQESLPNRKRFPLFHQQSISYEYACSLVEPQKAILSQFPSSTKSCVVKDAHFGDINSVMFYNEKYLISGGRDAKVVLWDVEKMKAEACSGHGCLIPSGVVPNSSSFYSDLAMHQAWVWSLSKRNETVSSAAFDSTIILSHIEKHSTDHAYRKIHSKGSLTKHMWMDDNIILGGSLDGNLNVFDVRAHEALVASTSKANQNLQHYHSRLRISNQDASEILCLANDSNHVLASSRKALYVLDLRMIKHDEADNGEHLRHTVLYSYPIRTEENKRDYCQSMVAKYGHVWIGTIHGDIYATNAANQYKPFFMQRRDKRGIYSLHYDYGHLITVSGRGQVNFYQPLKPLEKLQTVAFPEREMQPLAVDFHTKTNTLVLGSSQCQLLVYWPRKEDWPLL